jgi:hypothetical protein
MVQAHLKKKRKEKKTNINNNINIILTFNGLQTNTTDDERQNSIRQRPRNQTFANFRWWNTPADSENDS